MSEENFETMSLEDLAKRITRCASAADDQILKAAELICIARERFETELAGEITWTEWSREHIKLSASRRRDLLRVADSDDPRREIERIREMTRKRVEKHRNKKKAKQAMPLQGRGEKTVPAPAERKDDRQQVSETGAVPGESHLEMQKKAASLRNDGEEAGATAPEGADNRELLIRWAETAPLDEIEKVWAFVQNLERAESRADPEDLAAPAAA